MKIGSDVMHYVVLITCKRIQPRQVACEWKKTSDVKMYEKTFF